MKILAIGAHPDDIEIFMYGLLYLLKKRGDKIFLAIATDGSLGGNDSDKNLVNLNIALILLNLNLDLIYLLKKNNNKENYLKLLKEKMNQKIKIKMILMIY